MPRYMSGAVSMKIKSKTRVTSTRGMILISARVPPILWPPVPTSAESTLMATAHGTGAGVGLVARLVRRLLGAERATHDVQELEREAFHLHRPVLDPIHEEVVTHDGRNGGPESRRRRDQRLRDTRRHHRKVGGPLGSDSLERRHDAPDGAEQSDEGGGAGRRGQER